MTFIFKSEFLLDIKFYLICQFLIFINIGMNVGLAPVTGISLPFLSYGGSFLIVALIMIGIIENIIIKSKT